jgi:hypothetical protein
LKKIGKITTIFIVSGLIMLIPLSSISVLAENADVELSLTFTNLADPGVDHYEGWFIVDGSPVSTGKFKIDETGQIKDLTGGEISSFTVQAVDKDLITKFVLSLEPNGDTDTIPASIKPLAGDFSGDEAALTANLGVTLGSVSGKYILATPTNGADTNETSGIWFLDPSGPSIGLVIPDLTSTDWVYEGWVVIDGKPVTTGKFNKTNEFDIFDGYSGTQGGPPFPGEDFLENAPTGLTFPTDISGTKAVISIEPRNDNSPDPFQFKPLIGDIPTNAVDHTAYLLTDMSSSLATGTASYKPITTAPFDGFIEGFLLLFGIAVLIRIKSKKN